MKKIILALLGTASVAAMSGCKNQENHVFDLGVKEYYSNGSKDTLVFYKNEVETLELRDYLTSTSETIGLKYNLDNVDFGKEGNYTVSIEASNKKNIKINKDITIVIKNITNGIFKSEFDKSIVKIVPPSAPDSSIFSRGSGYVIDYNEETNKIYVATNYHVISGMTSFDEYVPMILTEVPRMNFALCGKVIQTGLDKKIDYAIIEVDSVNIERVTKTDDITCKNTSKPNFKDYKSFFNVLRFETVENYENQKSREDYDFHVKGYPSGNYAEVNLTYAMDFRHQQQKEKNAVMDMDFDIQLFNSFDTKDTTKPFNIVGGISGSAIVNDNLRITGIVFANYPNNGKYYAGVIHLSEINKVLTGLCNVRSNIALCTR